MECRYRVRATLQASSPLPAAEGCLNVVIAVATYRRPQLLQDCLEGIARLTNPSAARLAVVVVDNDCAESARPIADARRCNLPWPLHYCIEPQRNISLARNCAVRAAAALRADFVAFIDDDEIPEPGWLQELLRMAETSAADVVWGPVFARYPADVAPWIREGHFIQNRTEWPTGHAFCFAYTCNVLVRAPTFASVAGPFDPFYGLSGGGDVDFFMRANAAGARIVWAAQARVHETIPQSRASARWILRRAFRTGNSTALIHKRSLQRGIARYALRALALMGAGALLAAPAALFSRARAMRWICRCVHGAGGLAGLVGYQFCEYREVHGQ